MKHHLKTLFTNAFNTLKTQNIIPVETYVEIHIERTRDSRHGDFACNIALSLAKIARMPPRKLAEKFIAQLPQSEVIAKTEIAGPGFINIFLHSNAYHTLITDILDKTDHFGYCELGKGKSVLIEFVSANPTGPLHVGHGRGAAYGAALADLLATAGYKVHREYYVNDAGRQMDILATSVWLRYLELCGEKLTFPSNGYKGDYIWDISANIHRNQGDIFRHSASTVFDNIPLDAEQGGNKELHIDALIKRAKKLLGGSGYEQIFQEAIKVILDDIRADLENFGVYYDEWFLESQLTKADTVNRAIQQLTDKGFTYEKDGALWFKSSQFDDEKDRVLVRENGLLTYFSSDIAYHLNKLERGFDILINIWGADHHGYVPRVKAAMTALGADAQQLTVLLVQFANLYRGKERLPMSTRSGEFVTLRALRKEVGNDATRFFYVQRRSEQHLDFDLELAKSQTNDNPVYYIQYAHARISSVFKQLAEKNLAWIHDKSVLNKLDTESEQTLLVTLSRYPESVESAAQAYAPHQLTYYLRDLANDFHTYYNAYKFLVDDADLRNARLSLIAAVRQILRNGLKIIGVSAPESM